MHTVQAADTSLLFECTMLHSIQGLFGPVTRAMKGASPSRPLRRPGVPRVTTEATRHVNKYWAITMHKSQRQKKDKAVVNLGKSESTAGLTFVCLSRAKRLVYLLIELMPLKRLFKIGDTPTFQLRLREEVRLNTLAGQTLRLHGGVE